VERIIRREARPPDPRESRGAPARGLRMMATIVNMATTGRTTTGIAAAQRQ
jgi:hypothetical protein